MCLQKSHTCFERIQTALAVAACFQAFPDVHSLRLRKTLTLLLEERMSQKIQPCLQIHHS
jgi:hypothetical protein